MADEGDISVNIHEYQAKELYRQYGVPTAKGFPAFTVDEAVDAAKKLPGPVWVVKAQIHAGGRGKGKFKEAVGGDKGGVRLAKSIDEVKAFAGQMLGSTLVTLQTGAGRPQGAAPLHRGRLGQIARELYLSALVDRRHAASRSSPRPKAAWTSRRSRTTRPRRSSRCSIDPASGYSAFHGRKVAVRAGPERRSGQPVRQADRQPLSDVRREGHGAARDQSAGRHQGRQARLPRRQDELRFATRCSATRTSSSCAISTRRIRPRSKRRSTISPTSSSTARSAASSTAPASPWRPWTSSSCTAWSPPTSSTSAAGATKEKVSAAFKIILNDPNVKGILVNIFGGIMRCDIIAEGVVAAARELGVKVPLVVRLEGTNVELGKKIMADSPASQIVQRRRPRRCRQEDHRRRQEGWTRPWPSSSTRTPRSSARASPAARAPSTRSRPSSMAPRSSAA